MMGSQLKREAHLIEETEDLSIIRLDLMIKSKRKILVCPSTEDLVMKFSRKTGFPLTKTTIEMQLKK